MVTYTKLMVTYILFMVTYILFMVTYILFMVIYALLMVTYALLMVTYALFIVTYIRIMVTHNLSYLCAEKRIHLSNNYDKTPGKRALPLARNKISASGINKSGHQPMGCI